MWSTDMKTKTNVKAGELQGKITIGTGDVKIR